MRLFVSVGWTQTTIAYLEELQRKLKEEGVQGYWRRGVNLHLTLKFLGEVDPSRISELRQALAAAALNRKAFLLELSGIGVFPNAKSPRVLWVGANHPELFKLQQSIESKLESIGFEPEHRAFRAHITLATGQIMGLNPAFQELYESYGLKEWVDRFELMESVVVHGVRTYRCLDAYQLKRT